MVGLVNVQHIDLVVPTPRVEHSRLGIFIHKARAVFHEQTEHGRGPGPSIEPDGEGSSFRVLAGLKEPKEAEDEVSNGLILDFLVSLHLRVDGIVLRLAVCIFKEPRRKMDVAGIRLDAWSGLANARLIYSLQSVTRQAASEAGEQ